MTTKLMHSIIVCAFSKLNTSSKIRKLSSLMDENVTNQLDEILSMMLMFWTNKATLTESSANETLQRSVKENNKLISNSKWIK